VTGRQRQLVVDTPGLVLKVVVSAAEVQDRDGARLLAPALRFSGPDLPRRSLVGADAAYGGHLGEDLRQLRGWDVEVVNRSDTQARSAFAVQPHRWIVERTFSWFGGFRRLRKDDAYQVERGAHLCRHEPPHAASAGSLACSFQLHWMTFKTVSKRVSSA
jgi:putative transposase